MSYLRLIMQRLHDRSRVEPSDPQGGESLLEGHLELYGARLRGCSNAMLDYEVAWLDQHIETLELCFRQPAMLASAGGAQRVGRLLEESLRFRRLLEQCRRSRGLGEAVTRASVLATEHAWELTDPSLRRAWGFPAAPPTDPAADPSG